MGDVSCSHSLMGGVVGGVSCSHLLMGGVGRGVSCSHSLIGWMAGAESIPEQHTKATSHTVTQ